jgi:mannose-6-phosphate isomerase-like protein (cupin superfamily)
MQRRVVRATGTGWEGVETAGYTPQATGTGVARHTIVGSRKADPSEPGPRMELRYFEVAPGSASRLEKHEHEHYVIVRKGLGYAVIGEEPFGFYCFVDTCRDFSQQPTSEELDRLQASSAGAIAKPFAVPPPSKSLS